MDRNKTFPRRDRQFAAMTGRELADQLQRINDQYYDFLNRTNIYGLWKTLADRYYKGALVTGGTKSAGDQGELTLTYVNDFRNIVQHILVMTTSQRLALEPRAVNTDYKSSAAVKLSRGLLDYYVRDQKLDKRLSDACELGIWAMEGWTRCVWNPSIGEDYAAADGTVRKTGDVEVSTHHGIDIIRDTSKMDCDHDWLMVRTWKNRFDMAALYPEWSEKILRTETFDGRRDWMNEKFLYPFTGRLEDSDLIPVYEFYHRRTPSVPEGRYALWLGGEVLPVESGLPYNRIPLYQISPSQWNGTCFGYSQAPDMATVQESMDILDGAILTNEAAFSVQNIWLPPGADVSAALLHGGLNFIKCPQKPEVLQLCATPPEVFTQRKNYKDDMERIGGINSVTRGEPEASLRSGNALALIQSMAIQFNQGLQAAWARLAEDIGSAVIDMLQRYASVERVVSITGKNNQTLLQEFKGADLKGVSRVIVDLGNPLQRTIAGRVQIAESLLANGMLANPQQYLAVLENGKLEAATESATSALDLIQDENEHLMMGEQVPVMATDDHRMHITEHNTLLQKVAYRMDPELAGAVLDHITMHVNALRVTDPGLLALLGQQALPPQIPGMPGAVPGAVPGMPGGEPSPGASSGGAPGAAVSGGPPVGPGTPPAPANPEANIRPPAMPKNPLTGREFNGATGGMAQ